MIETTIYTLLNVDAITSIVATFNSAAIWPNEPLTNGVWPYVVYTCDKQASIFNLGGPSGVSELELEIFIQTKSVVSRDSLSATINGILNGYQSQPIQGIFLTDDSPDKIGDEEEGTIYTETMTYRVFANV